MLDITVDSLDFDVIQIKDQNSNIVEHKITDVLRIDEHNLEIEINKQPAKYIYWASILEKLRSYLEAAELKEERIRASLYEKARESLIEKGTPKPTKDQIESWILLQEDYVEVREQVLIYQKFVKHLSFVVKALEQRHSMLVQLSALKRDERDYERSISQL